MSVREHLRYRTNRQTCRNLGGVFQSVGFTAARPSPDGSAIVIAKQNALIGMASSFAGNCGFIGTTDAGTVLSRSSTIRP